jgi:Protein of unknown function (DUF3833)
MRTIKLITMLGAIIMFTSCSNHSLTYYNNTTPKMDIKEYFNGPIKAWGMIQDWRGRVLNRFDLTMIGEWQGDVGTLAEQFYYYTGTTQKRVWHIKKLPDGSYTGTASDILDKAVGKTIGSAARWSYVMNVPVGNTTYRLRFDDWMWQMNNGVLINRSYLKKFGITVAELTIFMQKQPPTE